MQYKERDHRRSGHTHTGYPHRDTGDMKKQTGDPHTYPGDTKKQTQEIKLRDHMRYKETDT
jgi:hypothetical protein